MRRLLGVLAFFVLAADARASCIHPEPRRQIKDADAAFVGRFESSRGDGMGKRWMTFRVEQVVKGELGESVEVHEPGISSAGLPNFSPGDRVGLMMNRHADGTWRSQCQQAEPEELADATKPIPRPPGRGTAAYLISGRFGDDASVAWLDRRGRALAYGFVGGGVSAVCPGGRRFVMLGNRSLTIRRTRDLKVLERRAAPSASAAHCLGDDVYVVGSKGIYRGNRRIWDGRATGVAFAGRTAYVVYGHTLARVDLPSGRGRVLAELPLGPEHEELRALAVRGHRVAVVAPNHSVREGEPPSKLAVFDLRTKELLTVDLAKSDIDGEVEWVGADRFAFLPTPDFWGRASNRTAQFYDARLRLRGEVPGWSVRGALGGGGAVVGIVGHRVERGSLSGHSEMSRLPTSNVSGLFRLGRGVKIRATRRGVGGF